MDKVNQNKTDTSAELLMLRMEIKAIRDRVLLDMDAALARIDQALPPIDPERYRPKTAAQYKAARAAMRRSG